MKVLLDTNIHSLAIIARIKSTLVPGFTNRMVYWQAIPKPTDAKISEIRAIAAFKDLCSNGRLEAYIDPIVRSEKASGRSWPRQNEWSLLTGIELKHVNWPLKASPLTPDLHSRKIGGGDRTALARLVQCVISAKSDSNPVLDVPETRLLKEICRSLATNHYDDAFILLTTETAGLDAMVSTDRRFRNALTTNKRLSLRSRLLSPVELILEMGRTDRCELPIEFGEQYYLNGRKFD